MALRSLEMLNAFSAHEVLPQTPSYIRTLFSPVDDARGAMKMLLESTSQSLVMAMCKFDDEEFNAIILEKLKHEDCFVQITLDWAESAAAKEHGLLAGFSSSSSVAISKSTPGAMMHMKMIIIDGVDVITGSGDPNHDNQLTVVRDYSLAAHSRARIDSIHSNIIHRSK